MNNELRTTQRSTLFIFTHRLRGHEVVRAWSPWEPRLTFWFCMDCGMAWRRMIGSKR